MVVSALEEAHSAIKVLVEVQEKMGKELGKEKRDYPPFALDADLKKKVLDSVGSEMQAIIEKGLSKHEHNEAFNTLRKKLVDEISADNEDLAGDANDAFSAAQASALCGSAR